ncbi:MAG: translesion error-prone DNA polymerase V autoproteolytic subunit [Bacteroidia bacterium]|nr:translesion error-prone DNA polymerase V autoproteolytic subunit [Bacteroidia bacterium]
MDNEDIKRSRGGKREGAGRPKGDSKLYTFRVSGDIASVIDAQENKTEFIKESILRSISAKRGLEALGEVVPAERVNDVSLPFFDNVWIVAGFPIPLDNDEKAQNIELLQMLCPHPESCYLVRVQGNSMIDANIYSDDIIIVDKSKRNPSKSEIAVCELNGEYTLKRVGRHDGKLWLVPANPDYPEIEVKEDDDFSIWGVVTYVIHQPKNG